MTRQAPGQKAWGKFMDCRGNKAADEFQAKHFNICILSRTHRGHMIRMVLGLMTIYAGPDPEQQRAAPAHQAQKQIPNNQLRIIT